MGDSKRSSIRSFTCAHENEEDEEKMNTNSNQVMQNASATIHFIKCAHSENAKAICLKHFFLWINVLDLNSMNLSMYENGTWFYFVHQDYVAKVWELITLTNSLLLLFIVYHYYITLQSSSTASYHKRNMVICWNSCGFSGSEREGKKYESFIQIVTNGVLRPSVGWRSNKMFIFCLPTICCWSFELVCQMLDYGS